MVITDWTAVSSLTYQGTKRNRPAFSASQVILKILPGSPCFLGLGNYQSSLAGSIVNKQKSNGLIHDKKRGPVWVGGCKRFVPDLPELLDWELKRDPEIYAGVFKVYLLTVDSSFPMKCVTRPQVPIPHLPVKPLFHTWGHLSQERGSHINGWRMQSWVALRVRSGLGLLMTCPPVTSMGFPWGQGFTDSKVPQVTCTTDAYRSHQHQLELSSV